MLWLVTDVDTEFDHVRFSGKPRYSGDPGLTEGVPHLLEFFARYNIRATFHIQEQSDPEQSILLRYPEVYEQVSKHGQEVSVHVHIKRADYAARKSEITAAVNRLRKYGYNVSSFKTGWYFSNENTIKVLEELNIAYDCSPLKNSVVGSV